MHEIDLCWEDMAPPCQVEAWAAYHALTPECLAGRLYRLLSGKGCEETPGEEDVQATDDDPALSDRCLKAARSALDNLFDEDSPITPGDPGAPMPVTAGDVFAAVYRFTLEAIDRHLLAAGGIGACRDPGRKEEVACGGTTGRRLLARRGRAGGGRGRRR